MFFLPETILRSGGEPWQIASTGAEDSGDSMPSLIGHAELDHIARAHRGSAGCNSTVGRRLQGVQDLPWRPVSQGDHDVPVHSPQVGRLRHLRGNSLRHVKALRRRRLRRRLREAGRRRRFPSEGLGVVRHLPALAVLILAALRRGANS